VFDVVNPVFPTAFNLRLCEAVRSCEMHMWIKVCKLCDDGGLIDPIAQLLTSVSALRVIPLVVRSVFLHKFIGRLLAFSALIRAPNHYPVD
jgi:hypothetical protein